MYDEQLSPLFSSFTQKHLMCLSSVLSLMEKKKSTVVLKRDLLMTYNQLCCRLFLPKADALCLNEMLSLFGASNILEPKLKEVKENEPVKETTQKTPAKNQNEEYEIKIAPENIRETLKQDYYFSKS